MSVTIDEVTSEIDMPVQETEAAGPPASDAHRSTPGRGDNALRDAIQRLRQRQLRLMAD